MKLIVSPLRMTALAFCSMLALSPAVQAHPADGQRINEARLVYGDFLPEEWSQGDIVFPPASAFPPREELTPLEKYMLCGTLSSPASAGVGFASWQTQLSAFVTNFYDAFGYVPPQLDLELVRSTPGYKHLPAEQCELLRNPLTGAWPRLDAASFSPGDVYIRPLSAAEKQHFAQYNPQWQSVWLDRVVPAGFDDEGCPIEASSEVFYLLMWGADSPLRAQFVYSFTH